MSPDTIGAAFLAVAALGSGAWAFASLLADDFRVPGSSNARERRGR